MNELERLADYLKKARAKPVHSLSQEMDQQILIWRLETWLEREKKCIVKEAL